MATQDKIKKLRIEKLEALKKVGLEGYPAKTKRDTEIAVALNNFDVWSKEEKMIVMAGRIMSMRGQGGIAFIDLRDESGSIQLVFKKDSLKDFNRVGEFLDIGDFIEAGGHLFKTQRGENSLFVESWKLLTKTLRPLPSEWYGLKDVEERFRRRYLDLILNDDVKKRLVSRSKIIQAMREFLNSYGFLEVETPILQTLPGGALAKPFQTKLNALDMDLYLRIAPELYLKRLMVGGFEKIYEIGRNFRNEGMDRSHNPEFTMMELYWAYQDYERLMALVENMLVFILNNAFPQTKNPLLVNINGNLVNFKKPWARIEFKEVIKKYAGLDADKADAKDVLEKMKERKIEITKEHKKQDKWELVDELYKKVCLPNLIQPTFVIHLPVAVSPLAKLRTENEEEVQRFLMAIGGVESGNAFSELNDPIDQGARFKEQEKKIKVGNEEASRYDKDFVEALEYGMPPTAGIGIGIDRLVMLLTNAESIKEIIFFPFMKKNNK
ncbi:MAG: lysine--tRNA ligase [bacterium]|nr:lysine--tRNA ligase [bacterium]